MALYYVNGKYAEEAHLSVKDLGVARGYGVFEYLRTYGGCPFCLWEHLERLEGSVRGSGLDMPMSQEEIAGVILEMIGKGDEGVKITVTAGMSEHSFLGEGNENLIVEVAPFEPLPRRLYERGVKLATFKYARPFPEVKSLGYMPGAVAMARSPYEDAFEMLYVDESGRILEAMRSNFFAISERELITPKDGVLEGITRKLILEMAKGHFDVVCRDVYLEELSTFDEIFITSSIKEILPVVKIDNQQVGNGQVGINTQFLLNSFQKLVAQYRKNSYGVK